MSEAVLSMELALGEYLQFVAVERRLAPSTCRAYARDVRACLAFLAEAGIRDLGRVGVRDLRAFLAAEAVSRPAASSQSRTVAALKSFFGFCAESEIVSRDVAGALRTPKKREALPDVLDRHELRRLLGAPELTGVWERCFAGRRERDRLLLALFAYAGLRRAELLALDWDDVDLGRRLLRVRRAKGGRQRVVPIHPGLVVLFDGYLATRLPLVERALFLGVQGARMNETQLAGTFRHYVVASGVGARKHVTPHTLRHVFASELLYAGANLRQIQELLGHKHLDSTQRYTRVNAHGLQGAVKRLSWEGWRQERAAPER